MMFATLTRDLAPHKAGEDRFLPDDVAEQLQAEGLATNLRPFPPVETARPGKRYSTRAR